ncbi:hypothetical protein FSP39_025461 [Pinctada imbricata]|uniref:Uncharacterized protein n=1 Tax=Pinctada imbricata TaxID=66713 RepID=A0AA88XYF0_PINIB|nr:hypothetical protein FSP39_025461 [Pinctada imbricata]
MEKNDGAVPGEVEPENEKQLLQHILTVVNRLDNRIKNLENDTAKIEEIRSSISAFSSRIESLEKSVEKIYNHISQMEAGIEGLGAVVNTVIDKCAQNKKDIGSVDTKLIEMEMEMRKSEKIYFENMQKLQENVLDLKCRSMKYNLVFSGLEYQRDENVKVKLREFIKTELGLDQHIDFVNVHRFGSPGLNNARPIVAKFLFRSDLEVVLKNAYRLKGKQFGINEQFPREIENRRKPLYPLMRKAKKEGKKVSLVRDRLYIEGKMVQAQAGTEDEIVTRNKEYRDVLFDRAVNNPQLPPLPPRQYKRARSEDSVDDTSNSPTPSTPR